MKKFHVILLALAALALIAGGCSSNSDPVTTTGNSVEDFGTYTATDEAPAFGDSSVDSMMNEDQVYDDPVAVSPEVNAIASRVATEAYCFRMVWGNLERDSGVTDLTDWSGTLTVSIGAIVVTNLIRFEPGQDYLLPRFDTSGAFIANELGWVSKTSIGKDGIATRLYIPPTTTPMPVTVTYQSPQLTISFTQDELEDLDTVITISFGNAVSFQAMPCDFGADRQGALSGRWGFDESGQGVFYGKWISNSGNIMGALKGTWGPNSNGRPVFIGKYIDANGKFKGFIKGTYFNRSSSVSVNARGAGHFAGMIYDANRTPIGVLKGNFKIGNDTGGGFFAGRWCVGGGCFAIQPM